MRRTFEISLSSLNLQYSIVNCNLLAIYYIRRTYSSYNWKFVPFHHLYPFCPPLPYPYQPPICSLYLSLVFVKIPSINDIILSLCLTYFTYHNALKTHPCCVKWSGFLCYGWIIIYFVYMYHILFIHLSVDGYFVLAIIMLQWTWGCVDIFWNSDFVSFT